jgi:hypothetical protein
MAPHRAIGCFRRSLADHDFGRDEGHALTTCASPRDPERPPSAQAGRQLAPQRASPLNEQRLMVCFMADAHGLIVRKVNREPAGDLFWAPGICPPAVLPPPMSTTFPGHRWAGHKCPARSGDGASQPLIHIGSQCRVDRKLPRLWPASGSVCVPLRCCRAVLQTAASSGSCAAIPVRSSTLPARAYEQPPAMSSLGRGGMRSPPAP